MSIADCSITNVLASNYCLNKEEKKKVFVCLNCRRGGKESFASFFLYLNLTSLPLLFDQYHACCPDIRASAR